MFYYLRIICDLDTFFLCMCRSFGQLSGSHSEMLNNCKLSQFSECINKSRAYATHLLSCHLLQAHRPMTHLFCKLKYLFIHNIWSDIRSFCISNDLLATQSKSFQMMSLWNFYSKPVLGAMVILWKIFMFLIKYM